MSITTLSPRSPPFAEGSYRTPPNVGPGLYDLSELSSLVYSGHRKDFSRFSENVSFLSSVDRDKEVAKERNFEDVHKLRSFIEAEEEYEPRFQTKQGPLALIKSKKKDPFAPHKSRVIPGPGRYDHEGEKMRTITRPMSNQNYSLKLMRRSSTGVSIPEPLQIDETFGPLPPVKLKSNRRVQQSKSMNRATKERNIEDLVKDLLKHELERRCSCYRTQSKDGGATCRNGGGRCRHRQTLKHKPDLEEGEFAATNQGVPGIRPLGGSRMSKHRFQRRASSAFASGTVRRPFSSPVEEQRWPGPSRYYNGRDRSSLVLEMYKLGFLSSPKHRRKKKNQKYVGFTSSAKRSDRSNNISNPGPGAYLRADVYGENKGVKIEYGDRKTVFDCLYKTAALNDRPYYEITSEFENEKGPRLYSSERKFSIYENASKNFSPSPQDYYPNKQKELQPIQVRFSERKTIFDEMENDSPGPKYHVREEFSKLNEIQRMCFGNGRRFDAKDPCCMYNGVLECMENGDVCSASGRISLMRRSYNVLYQFDEKNS